MTNYLKKRILYAILSSMTIFMLFFPGCKKESNNTPVADNTESTVTAFVTAGATLNATLSPTEAPTMLPTALPTATPTEVPTATVTAIPTTSPIATPTIYATMPPSSYPTPEKPVIYLYPESETEVSVRLDYKGKLTCTYPEYNDGWAVIAKPDGSLRDISTGREYSYLFWEGIDDTKYDMTKGFVVKGEDTAEFLQETLAKMGLTPKEYNEFIVYWLPKMQNNPYNLITFQGETYTETAKLIVSPNPDSVLRVFMVYTALDAPIEVEMPEIEVFERKGFTLVEWGGTEI